jgi:hypothetical protein
MAILIPLLFSIIIITEILNAECDLTNKQVKAGIRKSGEVCLMEDVNYKINRLIDWSDGITTNINKLFEWTEIATRNINALIELSSHSETKDMTKEVRNSMYV